MLKHSLQDIKFFGLHPSILRTAAGICDVPEDEVIERPKQI
jgi:hypothetical protein